MSVEAEKRKVNEGENVGIVNDGKRCRATSTKESVLGMYGMVKANSTRARDRYPSGNILYKTYSSHNFHVLWILGGKHDA